MKTIRPDTKQRERQLAAIQKTRIKGNDHAIEIIDYHHSGDGDCGIPQRRKPSSFAELGDYLVATPPSSLESRVLLLSRHEERPENHFGKAAVRQEKKRLVSVTSKIAALIACVWQLDQPTLDQSATFTDGFPVDPQIISLPEGFAIENAGAKDDHTGTTSIHFVHRLLLPCLPRKYGSDIWMYTTNLHTAPPRLDSVTLIYLEAGTAGFAYERALVSCSSKHMLSAVSTRILTSPAIDPGIVQDEGPLAVARVMWMTRIVHAIIDQLSRNIMSIDTCLSDMRYAARNSPSYLKLNYVLHLQDHLRCNMQSLEALKQLHSHKDCTQDIKLPYGSGWNGQFALVVAELSQKLATSQEESTNIYLMTKDQVDAKNSARNRLFAVVAAIYLPFTLASGVLGMNIKQFIGDGKTAPNWTLLLAIGLPLTVMTVALPLTFDTLRALVQQYAGSRPQTFKWLLWIAGPLIICVVVIVVVLIEVTKK